MPDAFQADGRGEVFAMPAPLPDPRPTESPPADPMTGPRHPVRSLIPTQTQTLRGLYPHGHVVSGGRVACAWITVERQGALAHVRAIGRSQEGEPQAFDAWLDAGPGGWAPCAPPPFPSHPDPQANFGLALRAMLSIVDGRGRDAYARRLTVSLVGDAGGDGTDAATATHAVARHAGEAAATVEAFAATLDPHAVDRVRRSNSWESEGRAWEGVDGTFSCGEALMRAKATHPHLASTLTQAWRAGRTELAGGADPSDVAFRHLASTHLPRGLTREAFAEAEASFLDLPADVAEAMARRSTDLYDDADQFVERLSALSAVPLDWHPRGTTEWRAWFDVADVVRMAARDVRDPGDLAAYLGARGRWAEWGGRVARTVGIAQPGDAAGCVLDMWDLAAALSAQLLDPAVALAQGLGPDHATDRVADDVSRHAAFTLAYSGRTLRRCLEASRTWHSREALVAAALASSWRGPGEVAPSDAWWGRGLPDHRDGGLWIHVIGSKAGLVDEGGHGPDAQGVAGLAHCVAARHVECASGRSRVASVRRLLPGGGHERLSTVAFGIDGTDVTVTEHRGRLNAEPSAQARALVDAYVGLLRSGLLPIDRDGLRAVPDSRSLTARAGYAWHRPGAWETVRDLWRPVLPGPLKGVCVTGLARLVAEAASDPTSGWRPKGPAAEAALP